MVTGNKGEWSEFYVLLKLLHDFKLYSADANLNKLTDLYLPILKIIRDEQIGEIGFVKDKNVKIIKEETNEILSEIKAEEFLKYSMLLLNKINQSSATFGVPEIYDFMNKIYCNKIKSNSSNKEDIKMVIHDTATGLTPMLGFSIKSMLGSPSTLINSSTATNLIYKINGITDNEMEEINNINTKSKIKDRIKRIYNLRKTLDFARIENQTYSNSLMMIDSNMPQIIAQELIIFYRGICNKVSDVTTHLKDENFLNFNNPESIYEYKIKKFLTAHSLGLMPATPWNGYENANGGYIIVKADGDVVCYHLYHRNLFEDYLYSNVKFETPSSSRHNFGHIYKEKEKYCIKLNLQLRFM